jgi:hypothetical protein
MLGRKFIKKSHGINEGLTAPDFNEKGKEERMCSPSPVVPSQLPIFAIECPASAAPRKSASLRAKLSMWMLGWKQTVIAELACLGLPEEGFYE